MATFLNDTMTDSSGTLLPAHTGETGATWTKHTSYSSGVGQISTANRVRCNSTNQVVFHASGSPANADYEVQADLFMNGTSEDHEPAVAARIDTGANTFYALRYRKTGNVWELLKRVAGTTTVLGSWSETLVASDTRTFKLRCSGTSIKGYVAGVERISVTDSAISAAGKAGIAFLAASANTSAGHLDNVSATDVASTVLGDSTVAVTIGGTAAGTMKTLGATVLELVIGGSAAGASARRTRSIRGGMSAVRGVARSSRSPQRVALPPRAQMLPTVLLGLRVVPGVDSVSVFDESASSGIGIDSYLYVLLLPNGTPTNTPSTDQNPIFTGVTPGTYTVRQTVYDDDGTAHSVESDPFTVNPGVLATPTLAANAPTGLVIPLALSAVADQTKVNHRRVYYKLAATPTEADPFNSYAASVTAPDFTAPSAGIWHFKAQDMAEPGLATDSALSLEATREVTVSGSAPGEPVISSATPNGSHRIDLVIVPGADAGNTNIYRAQGASCTPSAATLIRGELAGNLASYSDQTVPLASTQYTYVVGAINTAGETFSDPVSATTDAQGAWPELNPFGARGQGAGVVVVVDGRCTTKNFPGAGFNYSPEWQSGKLSDGVTDRVQVIADPSAKWGSVIRKYFEGPNIATGYLGDKAGFHGKFWKPNFTPEGFRHIYYAWTWRVSANFRNHPGTSKLTYWGTKNTGNVPFSMHIDGGVNGGQARLQQNLSYNNQQCAFQPANRIIETMDDAGLVPFGPWNVTEWEVESQSGAGVPDGRGSFWNNGVELEEWNCVGASGFCSQVGWIDGTTKFTAFPWIPTCATDARLPMNSIEGPLYLGGSGTWRVPVDLMYFDLAELYIEGIPW